MIYLPENRRWIYLSILLLSDRDLVLVLKVKQFCSWTKIRTRESSGMFTSQKTLADLTFFFFLAKSSLNTQVLFHIIVIMSFKT